jgi:hypothetical protein
MTPNTVRAHLAFSYKAETYELDVALDLDRCLVESAEAPDFHLLLARAAGIDPYSYLYEVLESHDIEFSEPTGIAALSCRDGRFDWSLFEARYREEQVMRVLRAIAERTLAVRDLDRHPDLVAALRAAYRAGKGEEWSSLDLGEGL